MTDKLKILVIDDNQENRDSAVRLLGEEYDLTVVRETEPSDRWTVADKAPWLMAGFDAVLTDLWMPAPTGKKNGEWTGAYRGPDKEFPYMPEQLPIGLYFALLAKNQGVKHVAIVTDSHHHNDMLSSIMDNMSYKIPGERVVKIESRSLYGAHKKTPACCRGVGIHDHVLNEDCERHGGPGKRWDLALHHLLDEE